MTGRQVAPSVTHERLDDEVIAINLETGAYYALDDVAADCWTLLDAGASTEDVAVVVAERFAVEPATARDDVERFVAALDGEGLVLVVDASATASVAGALPPVAEGRAYVAPAVSKFDDLEELLLLDPIHQVDDAGWPVARP